MKNNYFYLLLFGAFLLVISCKKEKNNPDNNDPIKFELNPKTIIANETTKNDLITIDSTSLTFTGNSSQLENLKAGDILVSDITNIAEFGYLRKVVAIENSGSTTKVQTTNVSITEAVKSGSGEYTKEIKREDIYGQDTSGFKMRNEFLSFEINKSFDLDGNATTTNDTIEFSGSVDLNPKFQYDIDVKDYNLEHF